MVSLNTFVVWFRGAMLGWVFK